VDDFLGFHLFKGAEPCSKNEREKKHQEKKDLCVFYSPENSRLQPCCSLHGMAEEWDEE